MKRADVEDGHRPGVTAAEQVELRDAKKRIRLLEQENEVLRRAAAYLSRANLPGKWSSRSSVKWPRPVPVSGCRSRWRAGSWGCRLRGTTSGKPGPAVHDDLLAVVDKHGVVRHTFTAAAPNEGWSTDISEHPTGEGRIGDQERDRRPLTGPHHRALGQGLEMIYVAAEAA